MFERFTDRSRRVLAVAQEEARELDHAFIDTEHILLGLLRVTDGVAARSLDSLGVTYDDVRASVTAMELLSSNERSSAPAFTPRAKKVLELALREALALHHSYVGTEHILLGLVRLGDDGTATIFSELEVELSDVRTRVVSLISSHDRRSAGVELDEARFDDVIFRGVVRAVGQQLRPDLDANALDDLTVTIASELFTELRHRWTSSGNIL